MRATLQCLVFLLAVAKVTKADEAKRLLLAFPRSSEQMKRTLDLNICSHLNQNYDNLVTKTSVLFICADKKLAEEASSKLRSLSIKHRVQLAAKPNLEDRTASTFFDKFQRFEQMKERLENIDADFDFATLTKEGRTHENREIYLLKLSKKGDSSTNRRAKDAIFIDAGIHAREWIASSSAFYVIDKLIERFRDYSDIDDLEFYIMPMLNPDGYEYTHTDDRNWRKNRSPPQKGTSCSGVDLNRNFDVIGFGIGASKDPCSMTYEGPSANSEPEVQAASRVLTATHNNIKLSLSLHSYGQLWLVSNGYTKERPDDIDDLIALGRKAADAMKQIGGLDYVVKSGAELYPAGGASDDFARNVGKIKYATTIELPPLDQRHGGFELGKSMIRNVGEQVWAGINAAIEVATA